VEPKDMEGIKFRSAEVPIRIEMFNTLGASAIPMAFPEVFTGLQQGTIDGQENPLSIISTSKFNEVQKYLSLSGHIYSSALFIINPETWNSYPEDVKNAIQKAADEARDYERQLVSKAEETLVQELKEAGMKVNEVDKEAFIDAVQPVWDNFREKYGSELIDAAIKYGN
jgi:TRAP-type C4-dicarboxylate transport system substrate-binding protein